MKSDLIQVSLNDQDEPVLAFTARDAEKTAPADRLEHKILGALLRRIALSGIKLDLVRTYADAEDKPVYEYQIRACRPDETDERPTSRD